MRRLTAPFCFLMTATRMRQHQIDSSLRELQASLDQAKLRRAASMTIAEKLRLGADLFDECIRWQKHIIQAEHPEFDPVQVDAELDRRRVIRRRLRDAGLVQPCPPEATGDKDQL